MRIKRLSWMRGCSMLCWLVVAVVPATVSAQNSEQRQELPDSPGAVIAPKVIEARLFQGQTSSSSSSSPAASQPTQSASQPSAKQKPVGTAVAEEPPTTGIAASNPSGAAIAPAKQRRVRTVLIRVGAILGAGVAVGTVAALASASPSRPPGSR
jgi:hypothetical protein